MVRFLLHKILRLATEDFVFLVDERTPPCYHTLMAEVSKKVRLMAYRNSLIDYERCVNGASFRDLATIFNLSESTVHDIVTAATDLKRKMKRSLKKPIASSPSDAFDKCLASKK